jgi:hypothetical protein
MQTLLDKYFKDFRWAEGAGWVIGSGCAAIGYSLQKGETWNEAIGAGVAAMFIAAGLFFRNPRTTAWQESQPAPVTDPKTTEENGNVSQ